MGLVFARIAGVCLTLGLHGCIGDVIPGAPLDGGEGLPVVPAAQPTGAEKLDAGAARGVGAPATVGATAVGGPAVSQPVQSDGGAAGAAPSGTRDAAPPVSVRADAGAAAGDPAPVGPPATPGARDYSSDRTKFLGAPRCNQAGALFCDDFESQAAGAQPGSAWSYPFGYKPVIDSTRAARGNKSLHFSIAAGMPAQIEEKQTFPATNNSFYGRMFVWLGALPTSPSTARFALVAGRGTGSGNEVRLDGVYLDQTKQSHFGIGNDGPLADTDGDGKDDDDWHIDGKEGQSVVRATDWICLEWLFKGDTSETRVWIDGAEQSSLHTTKDAYYNGGKYSDRSFVHPTYDALRIGWWVYQSDAAPSPFDLWIDEVAVDKERIGCVL